jgi:hypothetical protein
MRGDTSTYVFWIVALGFALLIAIAVARENLQRANRESAGRLKAADETRRREYELSELRKAHAAELSAKDSVVASATNRMKELQIIIQERKIQFPWLSAAIADYHALEAEKTAVFLETKSHPAARAAAEVREHARAKRNAEFEARMMRYRVEYYEKLFPWIAEYVGDDVPDTAVDVSGGASESTDDPAKAWLNDSEYKNLSTVAKNQLALDRWKSSRKSRWEIGLDYERFIGYNFETLGYDVSFPGAIEGLHDMGRDVIARRGPELRVIQCKYWSQDKMIHEKHIFQLFGSAIEYAFRLGNFETVDQLGLFDGPVKALGVKAELYTSTSLSDRAKEVAKKLRVEINEKVRLSDYPLVKCNISLRGGQKIYHLPFDQQYDRTKIKPERGEKYVYTVAEAENAGFRRAWKWRPDQA